MSHQVYIDESGSKRWLQCNDILIENSKYNIRIIYKTNSDGDKLKICAFGRDTYGKYIQSFSGDTLSQLIADTIGQEPEKNSNEIMFFYLCSIFRGYPPVFSFLGSSNHEEDKINFNIKDLSMKIDFTLSKKPY